MTLSWTRCIPILSLVLTLGPIGHAHGGAPQYAKRAPGEMIVKFTHELEEPADVLFELSVLPAGLSRIANEYSVQDIRPLVHNLQRIFPTELGSDLLGRRRQALDNRRAFARTRAPHRTARETGFAPIPDLAHFYVLSVPEDTDLEKFEDALEAHPLVNYAHPNFQVYVNAQPLPNLPWIPNDPYISLDGSNWWLISGSSLPRLWNLKKTRVLEAWHQLARPQSDPGNGVTVAVIDTGIDPDNADLASRRWRNPLEVTGNYWDEDQNGVANDEWGYDFTTKLHHHNSGYRNCPVVGSKSPSANVRDEHRHGTAMSGVIAASYNNSYGIAGIAPFAKIMPVKSFSKQGCGTVDSVFNGILYASNSGADILNLSFGADWPSPAIDEAVQYAHGLGAVVVASANGFWGDNTFHPSTTSPGRSPYAITVTGTDEYDAPFDPSRGMTMDIAAPAGASLARPPHLLPPAGILTLTSYPFFDPFGSIADQIAGYGLISMEGTSLAAAHVSGLAALILSKHPEFTNEEVRQVIRSSADDVEGPGYDLHSGYGRIHAERALTRDSALSVFLDAPQDRESLEPPIEIHGTVTGDGWLGYQVLIGRGYPPSQWQPLTTPVLESVEQGLLASWNPSREEAPDGWYAVKIIAMDADNNEYEARRSFILKRSLPGWPVNDSITPFPVVANITSWPGKEIAYTTPGEIVIRTADGLEILREQALGTWYRPVSAGDIDGDGLADIAVGTDYGAVMIKGAQRQSLNGPKTDGPVVVQDLDGDGRAEVIAVSREKKLTVWGGDGDFFPGWPKTLPIPAGPVPPPNDTAYVSPPAVGDIDGDGAKEIVVVARENQTASPTVMAFGRYGQLRWSLRTFYPEDFWPSRYDVVLGDVDADGRLEVVVVLNGTQVALGRAFVVLDGSGEVEASWLTPRSVTDLTLTDLDGDGDLEILSSAQDDASWTGYNLLAFHHDGSTVQGFPRPVPPITEILSADLDGDGLPELTHGLNSIRDHDSRITNPIHAWDGDGTPLSGWPRSLVVQSWGSSDRATTTLADLNEDGVLDLIAPASRREIQVMDLGIPVNPYALQWPTYRHDAARTGRFEFENCGNGELDPDEQCDGGACCNDRCQLRPAGAPCADDGNACTDDRCDASGFCEHLSNTAPCDDGDACTLDDTCSGGTCQGVERSCPNCEACDSRVGCVAAPLAMCLAADPHASSLEISDKPSDSGDRLTWKWRGPSDPHGPFELTDYSLCIFDESAGSAELLFKATAPADATCRSGSCWKRLGSETNPRGLKFKDASRLPDGVDAMLLRDRGSTNDITLKARGEALSNRPFGLPAPPVATPLRVQLQAENGSCWEATYADPSSNRTGRFKAKSD